MQKQKRLPDYKKAKGIQWDSEWPSRYTKKNKKKGIEIKSQSIQSIETNN